MCVRQANFAGSSFKRPDKRTMFTAAQGDMQTDRHLHTSAVDNGKEGQGCVVRWIAMTELQNVDHVPTSRCEALARDLTPHLGSLELSTSIRYRSPNLDRYKGAVRCVTLCAAEYERPLESEHFYQFEGIKTDCMEQHPCKTALKKALQCVWTCVSTTSCAFWSRGDVDTYRRKQSLCDFEGPKRRNRISLPIHSQAHLRMRP